MDSQKNICFNQYIAQTKATYRTADNIVLQTYVPKNPSLVKAQNYSKTVGVVSTIVYVYDMAVNFKTYGGFTKDFGKSSCDYNNHSGSRHCSREP